MTRLAKALGQRPELVAVFQQLCRDLTNSGAVRSALKQHPDFHGIDIPDKIDAHRRRHGCAVSPGGKRPHAPHFYRVTPRRGIARHFAGKEGR